MLKAILHAVALLPLRAAFSIGRQLRDLAVREAVRVEMVLKRTQETAIRIDVGFGRRFTGVDETENRSPPFRGIGRPSRLENAICNILE